MADPMTIPIDLLARLEAFKDALRRNGSVLCRQEPDRNRSWRLRFRAQEGGRRRHHALVLPDESAAQAVSALIRTWRQEYQQQVQGARQARLAQQQAARQLRRERRQRRRLLQQLAGGGRRRRQRIGRLYNQAARQGICQEIQFCLRNDYRALDPPRGRRSKSGLVLFG